MNESHKAHIWYHVAVLEYWVMGDFYRHLTLYNWVSSDIWHRLLLQLHTSKEFWVVGYFLSLIPGRLGAMALKFPLMVLSIPVKEKDLSSFLSHCYITEKNV